MKTHKLKTLSPYFEKCWQQSKTFEVRKNDRDFKQGDTVYLREYDDVNKTYSGNELRCTILYVLKDFYAIEKGYVVFSFSIEKYIEKNLSLNNNEFQIKSL